MPDPLGSALANPLCLDSRLGNAQTYLARDVPAWVRAHLPVSTDPRNWAIAGLSEGGTCSWQLAVNAPADLPDLPRHLRAGRTHPGQPGPHHRPRVRR